MEEELSDTFGERLASARERKGLSQQSVADALGCARSAVNLWENAYNFPELINLAEVAMLLDQSTDYLIWGNDVARSQVLVRELLHARVSILFGFRDLVVDSHHEAVS